MVELVLSFWMGMDPLRVEVGVRRMVDNVVGFAGREALGGGEEVMRKPRESKLIGMLVLAAAAAAADGKEAIVVGKP